MTSNDQWVLGLDVGIATIGWALLGESSIRAAGVWTFDAPETAKEGTPTAAIRRRHRGQRRVVSRRRQRMNAVRRLFAESGLLPTAAKNALKKPGLNPWHLRVEGLSRILDGGELAIALGHIARHRGFRSNAKRDAQANAADDTSKMKRAIADTQERLAQYRSVGEMQWCDARFRDDRVESQPVFRGRNRDGDYSRTILRSDLEAEVRVVFAAQRQLGNPLVTADLESRFAEIAFSQRPLRDSEDAVGACPFEPGERRTARRGYSFERFRLLSRLNALRLSNGRSERTLTPDEVGRILAAFGKQKKLSFKTLRKLLHLDPAVRFSGVATEKEAGDVVARTGGAADGTAALRGVLDGAPWETLVKTPWVLDRIAEIFTFSNDETTIRAGLIETGILPDVADAMMTALTDGRLKDFRGAAHISAKAARAMLPHLAQGLVYSEACAEAGYDHARSRVHVALDAGAERGVEAIRSLLRQESQTGRLRELLPNPVARKAVFETLKQVKAIIHEFGVPERIHVELARDVGKSREERDEITNGIEKRNAAKERLRSRFRELLLFEPSGEDLLRFELWEEQKGNCLYSNEPIPLKAIISSDNRVQVDHILPWSRFGDDSFVNKTLCLASANQQKKGRTPFEWFTSERAPADWDRFVASVESLQGMKGRKKRNYLLKEAAEREESFKNRNLGDTRYAARVVTEILKLLYPQEKQGSEKGGDRRVLARPGPLTARLRQGWGIESLKKVNGVRIADDRHHAIDAIVLAATSDGMLNRLTRAFQQAEREGRPQAFKALDLPWPEFRGDVKAVYDSIFVARAERCRARGEAHKATIRQVAERDGRACVYERRPVNEKFTPGDLERIKDPERNGPYVQAIRAWLEAGKPKDHPPLSPRGDPIRKVRLLTNNKVDVEIRGGAADRGEMARVDVFRKRTPKGVWQYFLVPIYPHEIASREIPPASAVPLDVPIDNTYEFLWVINPLTMIVLQKPTGEVIEGYFRKLDRNTGAITISPSTTLQEERRSIGTRTLKMFRKFRVDRLGRRFEVEREIRTWRGKACI